MISQYQIAGITIPVEAPSQLADDDAFSLYRCDVRESCDSVFPIELIPEEPLQLPTIEGQVVFQDIMHQVVSCEAGFLHLFHIPSTRGIAAWNWIAEDHLTIHYDRRAEWYYQTSLGCFNTAAFERILYHFRKYLFHCSYVDIGGEAILFSAPSGTGKTTQGLLWEQYGNAQMVNGDRGVLEYTADGYLVHGLPIAGSSGVFINRTLPLKAIFVVKQAPINCVTRLSHRDAFQAVFSEITMNTWNGQFTLDAADFALKLAEDIPVYQLECTISEEAVRVVEAVVRGREIKL